MTYNVFGGTVKPAQSTMTIHNNNVNIATQQ